MKFVTSKGAVWYLHSKEMKNWGRGKINFTSYYFNKIKDGTVEMPVKYKVFESKKGMPMLKKI